MEDNISIQLYIKCKELGQQNECAQSEFRVAQPHCCCLKSVADSESFVREGGGGSKNLNFLYSSYFTDVRGRPY